VILNALAGNQPTGKPPSDAAYPRRNSCKPKAKPRKKQLAASQNSSLPLQQPAAIISAPPAAAAAIAPVSAKVNKKNDFKNDAHAAGQIATKLNRAIKAGHSEPTALRLLHQFQALAPPVHEPKPKGVVATSVDPVLAEENHCHRVNLTMFNKGIAVASSLIRQGPTKLLELTESAVASLKTLFPTADPAVIVPADIQKILDQTPDVRFLVSDVTGYLASRASGLSPGPNDVSMDWLIRLYAEATPDSKQHIAELLELIGNGRVPSDWTNVRSYLVNTKGIALAKANSVKVRPIGIMDALSQTAAGVLARKTAPHVAPFCNYNFAVNVSAGTEAAGHCARAILEANPTWVGIQTDIENAYNSITRTRFFARLFTLIRSGANEFIIALARSAIYTYGTPSLISFKCKVTGNIYRIDVGSGVVQGHPCATQLFCLGYGTLTETVAKGNSAVILISFADDTPIIGPPVEAFAAVRSMFGLAPVSHRLNLNTSKFAYWSPAGNTDLIDSLAADSGIPKQSAIPSEQGILVAGTPVGTPEFMRSYADTTVNKATDFMDSLLDVYRRSMEAAGKECKQIISRMIRLCVLTVPHHLFRTTPPEFTMAAAKRLDASIISSLTSILNLDTTSPDYERTVKMIRLPAKEGGLGFKPAASNAAPAYMASFMYNIGHLARLAPTVLEAIHSAPCDIHADPDDADASTAAAAPQVDPAIANPSAVPLVVPAPVYEPHSTSRARRTAKRAATAAVTTAVTRLLPALLQPQHDDGITSFPALPPAGTSRSRLGPATRVPAPTVPPPASLGWTNQQRISFPPDHFSAPRSPDAGSVQPLFIESLSPDAAMSTSHVPPGFQYAMLPSVGASAPHPAFLQPLLQEPDSDGRLPSPAPSDSNHLQYLINPPGFIGSPSPVVLSAVERPDSLGDTNLCGPLVFSNGAPNPLRVASHCVVDVLGSPGPPPGLALPAHVHPLLGTFDINAFMANLDVRDVFNDIVLPPAQPHRQQLPGGNRDPDGDGNLPSISDSDIEFNLCPVPPASAPSPSPTDGPTCRTHRLPTAIGIHFERAKLQVLATIGKPNPCSDTSSLTPEEVTHINDYNSANNLNLDNWPMPATMKHLEFQLNQSVNRVAVANFSQDFCVGDKAFADFFNSCKGVEASAWLAAPGTPASGTRMSDGEFNYAVCIRLQCLPRDGDLQALTTFCPSCTTANGAPVPHSLHHCFKCVAMHGANIDRHNSLRDFLFRAARYIQTGPNSSITSVAKEPVMEFSCKRKLAAGSASAAAAAPNPNPAEAVLQPDILAAAAAASQHPLHSDDFLADAEPVQPIVSQADPDNERPASKVDIRHRADLLIATNVHKTNTVNTLLVDISVTHPVTGKYPSKASGRHAKPGTQAELRANQKEAHYNKYYVVPPSVTIVPVIAETGGRLNKAGSALFSKLARLTCSSGVRNHGALITYTRARTDLTQEFSTTLQIHNARAFRSYLFGFLRDDMPHAQVLARNTLLNAIQANAVAAPRAASKKRPTSRQPAPAAAAALPHQLLSHAISIVPAPQPLPQSLPPPLPVVHLPPEPEHEHSDDSFIALPHRQPSHAISIAPVPQPLPQPLPPPLPQSLPPPPEPEDEDSDDSFIVGSREAAPAKEMTAAELYGGPGGCWNREADGRVNAGIYGSQAAAAAGCRPWIAAPVNRPAAIAAAAATAASLAASADSTSGSHDGAAAATGAAGMSLSAEHRTTAGDSAVSSQAKQASSATTATTAGTQIVVTVSVGGAQALPGSG